MPVVAVAVHMIYLAEQAVQAVAVLVLVLLETVLLQLQIQAVAVAVDAMLLVVLAVPELLSFAMLGLLVVQAVQ
jgi:hypothetical protein